MFEPDLLNQKRESRGQDVDLFSFLSVLPESELRRVKFFIDQRLPQDGVESMNLEIELVNQYNTVKDLQDDTLADDDVPANLLTIKKQGRLVRMIISLANKLKHASPSTYEPDASA